MIYLDLFKEQHSYNTREATKYASIIPKRKTFFYGSMKDWNYMIDEIHFTPEDFMKHSEVIKKIPFCDKTTLITTVDNKNYKDLSIFI